MFLENKPTATISFTDIVQLMGGGTPKTDEDSFWNGNILFFTPKDISRSPFCISTEKHLTNEGLNNCSSRLYPPYTTFVTCRGTVGNLALAGVPMAMNQSCYALKGKNDFPALFVFSFTRYVIATMKKKASGAVFSALVTRDFEMEKVFEPNFEDAILFEKRVEPLFAQILANTNEIQQLLDLQNALLTQLSSRKIIIYLLFQIYSIGYRLVGFHYFSLLFNIRYWKFHHTKLIPIENLSYASV